MSRHCHYLYTFLFFQKSSVFILFTYMGGMIHIFQKSKCNQVFYIMQYHSTQHFVLYTFLSSWRKEFWYFFLSEFNYLNNTWKVYSGKGWMFWDKFLVNSHATQYVLNNSLFSRFYEEKAYTSGNVGLSLSLPDANAL